MRRKESPMWYQKERISGSYDKNEKFWESNSQMNELLKNSSQRIPRRYHGLSLFLEVTSSGMCLGGDVHKKC